MYVFIHSKNNIRWSQRFFFFEFETQTIYLLGTAYTSPLKKKNPGQFRCSWIVRIFPSGRWLANFLSSQPCLFLFLVIFTLISLLLSSNTEKSKEKDVHYQELGISTHFISPPIFHVLFPNVSTQFSACGPHA